LRRETFDRINLRGTQNVLDGCRRHGVARLIYTSSPSVVFRGDDQEGVDESAPYDLEWLEKNRCYYSLSKALAEQLTLQAGDDGQLRTCAIRPHLVWGPRDNHLIPRLIARARAGRLRRVGGGENLVDVTYVENAATAHLSAADTLAGASPRVNGRAYFISQGEPVNCWQWIDEVLAMVGLPAVRKSVSYRSARQVGGILEAFYSALQATAEPSMSRFLAAQLAKSHWFDISAARRDIAYVPAISTPVGMQRLASWLQSHA
jgi:nucleoside-diphosphate-sugar epimerase